jgi:hypothetical protein
VPDRIQLIAIVLSTLFLVAVLELVRRRKLVEEYSFLWIVAAIVMVAVSIWRELLHAAARELGVHDPPNVLLIALTAVVVGALLGASVILSRQRRQIDRLIEETAILGAEVRDLRAGRGDAKSAAEAASSSSYSPNLPRK